VARDDAVTCPLERSVGEVRDQIARSAYPFALVTAPHGVLLGRLPRSALDCDPSLTAEDVMEPGPKTFRPDTHAVTVAGRLAKRELRWAIVTDPEGRLIGVASREDLERAS
jgi:CBS domain-containing protein